MTKKLWQRVAAVAMATFMAACTLTTAFADQYNQDTLGSITVHKYSTPTAPDSNNVDYDGAEIPAGDTSSFGKPLAGAEFKLYMVDDPTSAKNENFDFTKNVDVKLEGGSGDYTVTFTDADGDTIVENSKPAENHDGQELGVKITDSYGIAKFENLNPGKLYILEESKTPDNHQVPSASSLIRVPLTTYDQDGDAKFNYDVHVYPKNVDQTFITKEFLGKVTGDVNDAESIGLENNAKYSWKITANFKNDDSTKAVTNVHDLRIGDDGTGTYGSVIVTDMIAEYFQADTATAEVYLIDAAGNKIETPFDKGTAYQLTYTYTGTEDAEFKVELEKAGIDTAIANDAAALVIEFDTTYMDYTYAGEGTDATEFNNKATAKLKAPTGGETTKEDTDIIPTVALLVQKIGVKPNSEGVAIEDSGLGGVTFVLTKDATGKDYVKNAEGDTLTATTDLNGNIIFSNIPFEEITSLDEDGNFTLYLVETNTPEGYQLKEMPIPVKINKTAIEAELTANNGTFSEDKSVYTVQAQTIKNYYQGLVDPDQPALQLPLTGGTGTVMLVIAGIGVLVLVGFLTVAANRKSRKEQ